MNLAYNLSQMQNLDRKLLGGKAAALARMAHEGLPIPQTICISTDAYDMFMDETGLRAQVLMEYHRKRFDQMRWEEMWDCSLRIQNMFNRTPMPANLAESLRGEIVKSFDNKPVDHSKAIVEAVYGLNQGLVDATVEPAEHQESLFGLGLRKNIWTYILINQLQFYSVVVYLSARLG